MPTAALFPSKNAREAITQLIIGIDPHKMSHTANAVDPATNTTATSRVRELSRGSRRKTDVIDAAAAASVAALHGDASVVEAADHTTVFAMLEERRANLAAQRVQITNQLHAVLRDLVAGGAEIAITAKSASSLLRTIQPESSAERTRKQLAHDLVRDVRAVDASLVDIEQRMTAALDEHDTRLREIDSIGAITAVRLLGRTGRASRFPSPHAFATYAGTAPIEISVVALKLRTGRVVHRSESTGSAASIRPRTGFATERKRIVADRRRFQWRDDSG